MSLASFGRELLAEVRRIAEQIVRRDGTNLRWATVTDTDPLRIRYDGETNPSIVPPQNLAAGLNIGDRVRVAKQDGQATIIGAPDGGRFPADQIVGVVDWEGLPFRIYGTGPMVLPSQRDTVMAEVVTFPAGLFTDSPTVVTASGIVNPENASTSYAYLSKDSVEIHWVRTTSAATHQVALTAVQTL